MGRMAQTLARTAVTLVFLFLGLGYVLFGVANLRPTYPLLEAVAAIAGGAAFLLAAGLAWRSPRRALAVIAGGTSMLTLWFAYDVPGETLFYLSLLAPLGACLLLSVLALATRYARRRTT